MPIAYGVGEALRAHQVYWAEKESDNSPMRFRQFVAPEKGEKVLLVDDILRSGKRFTELRTLLDSVARRWWGWRWRFISPIRRFADFGNLPIFYLAKMDAMYYKDSSSCDLCRRGVPIEKVWT